MLTSGTTGPPKRIDLTYDMLARSVIGTDFESHRRRPNCAVASRSSTPRWCTSAACSGYCNVSARHGHSRCWIGSSSNRWADAVRRHRPQAVSLVPAALRTVLHSDLTRDDLASIRAVTSGTAPLSAEDADAFTEKFGIPVLTSYAATEFGGGVAGWTLRDHQKYWQAKRGSVGRATLGAQLRVVDDDGAPAWRRPTGATRGETGSARTVGRLDADHRHGAHRRRRIPVDTGPRRSGHHPRRIQGDARRRARRVGEPPCGAGRGGGGPAPTTGSARLLWPWSNCVRPSRWPRCIEFLRTRLARYEIPTDIAIVEQIPQDTVR